MSEHSSAEEHRVYTAQVGGSNPSARTISDTQKVIDFFSDDSDFKIKKCFKKTESTVLNLFGKSSIEKLDCVINLVDVDVKFSIKESWMIPPECVNKVCILASLNFKNKGYAFGVLNVKESYLNKGSNRDAKKTISKKHYNKIKWIL